TYNATIIHLENLLALLHPFMPFITEEIWQSMADRLEGASISITQWPKAKISDAALLNDAAKAFEAVTQVRNLRNSKGLSPKEALELQVKTKEAGVYQRFEGIIRKLANVSAITFVEEKPANAIGLVN